jgi:tetratricopeptide (TPR) repeat protein
MIRTSAIALLAAMQIAAADPAGDRAMRTGIETFQEAYRKWDAGGFAKAAGQFQKVPVSARSQYWRGVAHFHRMLQLRSQHPPQDKAARAAMDQAIAALEAAVKLDARHAESHALLGTLYGMKIDGSFLRGIRFGPRVQDHQKLALAQGADNPRVRYLLGAAQFHTAGSQADHRVALATLLHAEKLFAAESARRHADPIAPRWGESSCLTFIGRSYLKLGDRKHAATYFRKALALHPGDHIARRELDALTKH